MESNIVDYKYEKVNTTTKDEKKEIPPVSYLQLYKFSTVFEKCLLLVAVIFCIVSGIFEVLFSVVFGRIVEAIANFGTDLMAAANETEKLQVEKIFISEANEFATRAGGISFMVFFSFYISTSLFNYTAMRQSFKIRELYFYQVIMQDIPWHDQSPTGDFASRITDDLRKIQDGLNDKASMSIYHITVIIAGLVQSLIMGWKLTLVCLASFPVSFLTMACIGKLSTKLAKDESEVYGEAGKVADETFTNIKTVTAFEGQREEMKRYDRFLAVAKNNNIRRYFFVGLTNGVTVFFMNVGVALAVWYGVTLIMEGRKGIGDYDIAKLVTIYNSIIMSTSNVGAITPFLETFNSAKGAAAKIFSIIEEEPVITKSYETGTKIDKMKGSIEFRTVDFSYPARKQVKVLKNFSLKIEAGETVALVGSSGCGKSTVIQLVQRFYDVDQGQIYIDGIEIGKLNLSSLRNRIGLVGQEPVLFDGTIAENIRLGNSSATQADVGDAARKSNAHSFILSFPNGYQTVIGERGTQLSGGQKQRIAIARAMVRKPAILLLDEATSALDSNSETIVQATLDRVGKDCTTIIVAHRLSTVRKADRIIVMENGTVVEDGSHDALMVTKGVYYNLVVAQLSSEKQDGSSHDSELESFFLEEKFEGRTNLSKVEEDHSKIVNFTTAWKILMSNLSPKWCFAVGVTSSIIYGIAFILCMIVLGKSLAILSGTDEEYVVSQVNSYAFQFIMIGFVFGISSILQAYFIGIAGENLTLSLRSSMFKAIIHQEIGWFDRTENGVGSLGARLAGEPSNVQNAIGLCAGPFLNVITMTFLLLGVGFYMSWKLLIGFFGFLPILVLMLYLEQKVMVRENLKSMEVLEQSTKLAVEAISNIRTVASLAIEKNFHGRYMMKLNTYRSLTIRNIHMQGIVYGLSKGSLSFSYIITIFYGAYLIKNKETDAATVIGLTEVFASTIGNLSYGLVFLANLTKGFVACNLIYELLNRVPEIKNVVRSAGAEEAIEGDVEYKSVSFSYPTRPDIKIFEDLNLFVLKGNTVALVGPSGCGKSTIVQLLLRFYDCNSGLVTFGDEDITRINLGLLRKRLGIVMQEPNLFSRTIGDNIAYGNLGSVVSRAEIIEAAKKANIHSFISTLPLGYDTFLGEKGTQLSGGQKQRIAIARALVRNPEILLLDEATSALDAESEKVVQEALNNARKERTCIVIAHRLKTIEDADVIAVVNEGKITERGTHQELMSIKGLYWKLYNLQLQ